MSKQRTLLAIVATDATFERAPLADGSGEAWFGKCLHCNARHTIALDGEPVTRATIEHILPRSHGGTDDLENLGIACAGCNSEKGIRHDSKRHRDAKLDEIIERLRERRRARWRDPLP